MKKKKGNYVRLGMFVTAAFALLIAGVYFIGQRQQLFNETFHLGCVFRDVNGLQAGNNVRFSGINVGIVADLVIVSDTAVRVDVIIDERVRKFIRKDANAIIGSEGLMGNKILIITPGTGSAAVVENYDMLCAAHTVTVDEIMDKLKVTSDNASQITGNLNTITKSILDGRGTLGKLFMDTVLAENLDQTISTIREGAGGFKQNMDAAKNSFLLRRMFKAKKNARKEELSEKTSEKDKKENRTNDQDTTDVKQKKGLFKRKIFSK